jgi:hypothetical protein
MANVVPRASICSGIDQNGLWEGDEEGTAVVVLDMEEVENVDI